MSYDIVLQGFRGGQLDPGGTDRALARLRPFITRSEPELGFVLLEYGNSRADVYCGDHDLLVNQVSGHELWDILVDAARQADWVIMPVGGPVALTRAEQQTELPPELAAASRLVSDGDELLALLLDD